MINFHYKATLHSNQLLFPDLHATYCCFHTIPLPMAHTKSHFVCPKLHNEFLKFGQSLNINQYGIFSTKADLQVNLKRCQNLKYLESFDTVCPKDSCRLLLPGVTYFVLFAFRI